MHSHNRRAATHLAAVGGTAAVALVWGTSGAIVRLLPLPAAEIACLRAAFGAVTLGLWFLMRRRPFDWSAARPSLPSLLVSGLLLAAHWLTYVMALQRAPIGTVLTGIYMAPILIAVFARRALSEQLTRLGWTAVLLSVLGSAMVLRPTAAGGWAGVGLISFSAITYAGSIIASKSALRALSASTVAAGQLGVTAVVLSPVMLIGFVALSSSDIALLGALGVVYSAVAMLAYLAALNNISVVSSAVLLCLEPVSGFVTGWITQGERFGVLTAIGVAAVLTAGTFTTITTAGAVKQTVTGAESSAPGTTHEEEQKA
ncbi:DMT family transporter [Actinoplanes sp. NPDC049265]|uniref:DMT family transporter n=1 Tax=Actinoplanes sp. NPDC049265 TaxID=3363902 RepID=UPI0037159BF8